jgi:hypothetical protein
VPASILVYGVAKVYYHNIWERDIWNQFLRLGWRRARQLQHVFTSWRENIQWKYQMYKQQWFIIKYKHWHRDPIIWIGPRTGFGDHLYNKQLGESDPASTCAQRLWRPFCKPALILTFYEDAVLPFFPTFAWEQCSPWQHEPLEEGVPWQPCKLCIVGILRRELSTGWELCLPLCHYSNAVPPGHQILLYNCTGRSQWSHGYLHRYFPYSAIHCYVAGLIPAVTPQDCTSKIINALWSNKKQKQKILPIST